ncbi:efflux RND transporter periplasmic adaptor subunit [Aquimarina intermedia]|uniref:Cobalt-zinc-cadmium efflux system membrane fusion protein n=1 Tax=Aquimarina intermedia TaxID=350814 RepID=A0A5S5C2G7_9FLAO|nr:efflux RND transporter periplasmic adaptor subunit [Aquimarina intermedia]TYP72163.1 cobalt-zinc-cadmium efflux system membrane fusion protein [Aquimarina intermedia]
MKKHFIYIRIPLATVILLLCACGQQKDEDPSSGETTVMTQEKKTAPRNNVKEAMFTAQQFDALQLKLDTLSERSLTGFVEANGQLEVPPQNEANVTAMIGANIASIAVIEGDQVKKNQVLAYVSHPNLIEKQTTYLNAYTKSEFLKSEFARQKKLYDAGVGSGMNYQNAKSEYMAANGMVQGLEAQLKQYNINPTGVRNGTIYQRIALRSPIEGFVEKVNIKTGQYVEPQTNLIEIVNTHHVHADLMVFERDVHKVSKGQEVRFKVQSLPGVELSAKIYSISKTFEEGPKAVHVHAEIENKEDKLIPGMYIQGRIEVGVSKTLALPESAVSKDGDRYYVFTAEREGIDWSFKPKEVLLGQRDGEWVGVQFLEPIAQETLFVQNNAYYLMAEMKKGDAAHSH